jgi:hypothetical protein
VSARHAVCIFAKYPRPGEVKTRLRPALTHAECAALYERLTAQTVARLRAIPGVDAYIAHAPDSSGEAHAYFRAFGLPVFAQEGADVGERMARAFARLFAEGYARTVLVGTDIPDMGPEFIERALAQLGPHDAVFGPAADGGYYLVALGADAPAAWPGLFRQIPWSTPATLRTTMARASELGFSVAVLDVLHDLDRPEDLARCNL